MTLKTTSGDYKTTRNFSGEDIIKMNVFPILLTLFAIIHFATLGQAFNSQHNNKDGKQRGKEVLWSN
jgi:hypothetical protein